MEMVPEAHNFYISGPTYLNYVNWNNANHKRCVLACLVQGVYVHEYDRRLNRTGPDAMAPPWWRFFHFHPVEILYDTSNHYSIIGAVFQLTTTSQYSPKYVIAFRGIITSTPAIQPLALWNEMLSCLRSFLGTLHNSTSLHHALTRAQCWVAGNGAGDVWFTGHSLGSTIALIAAKNMVMSGYYHLPTFLFNPPFLSATLENSLTGEPELQQSIHIVSGLAKASISALRSNNNLEENNFSALRHWVPCLFLNPGDPICWGYNGYFEQRLKMERFGLGSIEEVATRFTMKSLVMSKGFELKSEPCHLIPSAVLVINQANSSPFKMAHGLRQWWDLNLPYHHVTHRY